MRSPPGYDKAYRKRDTHEGEGHDEGRDPERQHARAVQKADRETRRERSGNRGPERKAELKQRGEHDRSHGEHRADRKVNSGDQQYKGLTHCEDQQDADRLQEALDVVIGAEMGIENRRDRNGERERDPARLIDEESR